MIDYTKMIILAKNAMKNSYSPYSNFKVGACVLTKSGKYYLGTNVENSSFGATVCAERSAVCCAVTDGEREFEAIAIVSSGDDYTFPCGICRQFISEFNEDIKIIVAKDEKNYKIFTLQKLLQNGFNKGDIKWEQ